jgi:hypothetical protein
MSWFIDLVSACAANATEGGAPIPLPSSIALVSLLETISNIARSAMLLRLDY